MSGPSQFQQFYQSDQHGRYLDIFYLNSYFSNPDQFQLKVGRVGFSVSEARYFITDVGEIFSFRARKRNRGFVNTCKYHQAVLLLGEKRVTYFIHRLVALAFVGGYSEKFNQVNHIDENKSNNHYLNLEWSTPQYNTHYGEGISKKISGEIISKSYPVVARRLDGTVYKEFPFGPASAVRFLFPNKSSICSAVSRICYCIEGRVGYKSAFGFVWERA